MFSSKDVGRCTVHDGEMWMHLDNGSLKIPPQLLSKSQILVDALSVAHPSVTRKVTVAAPKEWLHAWVVCYGNEKEILSYDNIKDLVNCLLVCFLLWNAGPMLCLRRGECWTQHFCPITSRRFRIIDCLREKTPQPKFPVCKFETRKVCIQTEHCVLIAGS
jgi:hypothetical protein